MSMSFDISPQAARAFREVMCNDYIRPLGQSHLHVHGNSAHLADNLPGGAKVYYNFDNDGNFSGANLKPGGLEGRRL